MTSRSSFGSRGQEQDLELLEEPGLVGFEPRRSRRGPSRASPVGSPCAPASRSSRAPASSSRTACRSRNASTVGSRRASSWPRRRSSLGSAVISGRASSAWIVVVLSRDLRQLGVEVAHDTAGGSSGRAGTRRRHGPAGRPDRRPCGRAARADGARTASSPSGTASPSASSASSIDDDGDLDHVVGRLLRGDHLDEDPGEHDRAHDRVAAEPRPELEDLVADGGDHRDEQDPAPDHDERLLLADQREREDREQDEDRPGTPCRSAWCAVGYLRTSSTVSGSPASSAWIVMCSAPWYWKTRWMSRGPRRPRSGSRGTARPG